MNSFITQNWSGTAIKSVLVAAVAAVVAWQYFVVKDLRSELQKTHEELAVCSAVVDNYRAKSEQLKLEREEALKNVETLGKKAAKVVSSVKSKPVENTLESIKSSGLDTAKEVAKLWNN